MQVAIGWDIAAILILSSALWFWLNRRLLPSARERLLASDAQNSAATYVAYSGLLFAGAMASACTIALAIVIILSLLFNFYGMLGGATPDGIQTIVNARSGIEHLLGWAQVFSLGLWMFTVGALALGWFMLSRSRWRKGWLTALEQRRSALGKHVAALDADALVRQLDVCDPAGVARIEAKVTEIIATNRQTLEHAWNAPRFQVGDTPGDHASIGQLNGYCHHLYEKAAAYEDGPAKADVTRQASELNAIIATAMKEVQLQFRALGGVIKMPLADALDMIETIGVDAQAQDAAKRQLLVEARMRDHQLLANQLTGGEPEFWHEWLAAGATSQTTIRSGAWIGSRARRIAFIALFLGFVGLGASAQATTFISAAQSAELKLTAEINNAAIVAAVQSQQLAPSTPASDAATMAQLRQAMHTDVARALIGGYGRLSDRIALTDDMRFGLRSSGAREQILALASRHAAPPFETTGQKAVYSDRPVPSAGTAADLMPHRPDHLVTIDDVIDHRIASLRSNDLVWAQLRAAAGAQRASVDLMADAFFDVTLPGSNIANDPAMRMLVERVTARTATNSLKAGSISKRVRDGAFSAGDAITARDRRLFRDFDSLAPGVVTEHMEEMRSGRIDPGSIHRRPIDAQLAANDADPAASDAGKAATYDDLFPSVASDADGAGNLHLPGNAGVGGGGGGFGGAGKAAEEAGHATVAGERAGLAVAEGARVESAVARSFGMIRFSGRVGGVVIGRDAPNQDHIAADRLEWRWEGGRIRLAIGRPGAAIVDLGLFQPALISAALAYAADGRVVTATLPAAQSDGEGHGIPARQVIVHPAIEDTGFACRAIQIDRFVDTFTDMKTPASQHIMISRLGVTLASRLLASSKDIPAEKYIDMASVINNYARSCGVNQSCFPFSQYSSQGIDIGFDDMARQCLMGSVNTQACREHFAQASPAARLAIDSGVREAPFQLDDRFDFLTGGGSHDGLWPLRFIIQAVPEAANGSDMIAGSKGDPWEFPVIGNELQNYIAARVAQDPGARAIANDMQQFVVLQRLFRLALAGRFGNNFPLEELVALQQATTPSVRTVRHEHWNMTPALYSALLGEFDDMRKSLEAIAADNAIGDTCRASVNARLADIHGGHGLYWLARVGEVPKACPGETNADQLAQKIAFLRKYDFIDEAIYLSQHEHAGAGMSCPAL